MALPLVIILIEIFLLIENPVFAAKSNLQILFQSDVIDLANNILEDLITSLAFHLCSVWLVHVM